MGPQRTNLCLVAAVICFLVVTLSPPVGGRDRCFKGGMAWYIVRIDTFQRVVILGQTQTHYINDGSTTFMHQCTATFYVYIILT